jgi:hypothetical protein
MLRAVPCDLAELVVTESDQHASSVGLVGLAREADQGDVWQQPGQQLSCGS